MRKIILFMHMSLDGFVCGPNGEQDWFTTNDDEIGKYMASDLLINVDTILCGRVLYLGFASFWPTVATNPAYPKELVDFARWMENTLKVVFSKTLSSVEWKNSRLAQSDPSTEIAKLKQQPGGDIVIFGGAGIVSAFTHLNLVDEYRIKVEPVVVGKGRRLFENISDKISMKLIKEKAFDSGVVGLYYEVIR